MGIISEVQRVCTGVCLYQKLRCYYRSRSGEIMYLIASVRPSVRLYVRALLFEPFDLDFWKSHYQSKIVVCVSTNRADAVDRLLILGQGRHLPWEKCIVFCKEYK